MDDSEYHHTVGSMMECIVLDHKIPYSTPNHTFLENELLAFRVLIEIFEELDASPLCSDTVRRIMCRLAEEILRINENFDLVVFLQKLWKLQN